MSNGTSTANVIPMRDFDRPAQSQQAAQFDRLLKECQDLALGRLEKSLGAMLDKVDETLWGLANDSQDRDTRDLYITAKDRASVDAFYQAAIAAGAKDNGAPGIRAHYHPNYYGAFVLDPDGHNIEAVCHTPGS